MKRRLLILVVFIAAALAVTFAHAAEIHVPAPQKVSAPDTDASIGRYRLVAAEYFSATTKANEKTVFKIDTKTGRTWILTPGSESTPVGSWKLIGN